LTKKVTSSLIFGSFHKRAVELSTFSQSCPETLRLHVSWNGFVFLQYLGDESV